MRHTASLRSNGAFRSLYARGKSAAGVYLAVYARSNRTGGSRVGFTVSTKLGGAVVRNRVRRRLREAYRLQEGSFTPGFDIVVVARGRAIDAPFPSLRNEMLALCRKLGAAP